MSRTSASVSSKKGETCFYAHHEAHSSCWFLLRWLGLPQLWDRPWAPAEVFHPSSSSCHRSHHCWSQIHTTQRHITRVALWAGAVNRRCSLIWFHWDSEGCIPSNNQIENNSLNNCGHQGGIRYMRTYKKIHLFVKEIKKNKNIPHFSIHFILLSSFLAHVCLL